MSKLIIELEEMKQLYLSAVAKIEESSDNDLKKEATQIIESVMVHENIALEEIQN